MLEMHHDTFVGRAPLRELMGSADPLYRNWGVIVRGEESERGKGRGLTSKGGRKEGEGTERGVMKSPKKFTVTRIDTDGRTDGRTDGHDRSLMPSRHRRR